MASGLRWAAKRAYLELVRLMPDRLAINLDYFRVFGALPDLAHPRRFSEKIQHMKLERDERLPALVDKVRVKDYVSNVIGAQWLIPTLWHGEHVTEDVLRGIPKPAVLKANHSSAQVLFLHANSNLSEAARTANEWRTYDHHVIHREWAYGNVRREVLIEPFIGEGDKPPEDYKFWVFDGAVRFIQVDHDRFTRHTRQFYTPAWKRLDIELNYPSEAANVSAPPHLDQMLSAATALAEGFRFVRVDLYDTPQAPLFGELTFSPEAGLCRFRPSAFDLELGESWAYPLAASDGRMKSFADAFRIAAATK